MRILLYTDNHFSTNSSLIRSRGEKYSMRLENQIKSLNWAENLANLEQCDAVFGLGDFFEQNTLNPEELTALKEIRWSGLDHYFLVGNHEMGRAGLEFSSAHLFNLCPNCHIVDSPMSFKLADESTEICLLPYILNVNKPIAEYFSERPNKCDRTIVFSHNDLKGIQYGKMISTTGFEIADIENFCDLYLNGHLHNGYDVTKKIINLGNLTGQNFNEDAFQYQHVCAIIDTEKLTVSKYENPHSFKFYKFAVNSVSDFKTKFTRIKNNAVVTVKCLERDMDEIQKLLAEATNVLEYKVQMEVETNDETQLPAEELTKINHISAFQDFVKVKVGVDEITLFELEKVCQ